MSAVKENALSKFIGLLYVAVYTAGVPTFQRLASVRALVNKNTYEETKVNADDTGTVLVFTKPECVIECTLLENSDVSLMDLIFPGTRANVAGTPVPVTGEAHGTGWTLGVPQKLTYKNGANTVVASITINEDATPLVLNTDYRIYVGDGINGELGYTYFVPIAAQTGVITADYTYTPNASAGFSFTKEQMELPQLIVKIEAANPADPTKKKTITLTKARVNGEFSMDFLDVVEAGDVNGSSLVFDLDDGGVFSFVDEILANP